MSLRRSAGRPRACSGLIYAAVPRMTPSCVAAGLVIVGESITGEATPSPVSAFARPKSSTFTVPSDFTLMLAGFRSRWTMPWLCAHSSASAICLAMGSASSSASAPLRDAVRQRRSVHQLQHQRQHAVGFFEPVDRRDVRMVQRGQHLGLALEPREPVRVAREGRRKDLHRDVAVELRVPRAIHLAHPAFAEQRDDFVGADASAGEHVGRIIGDHDPTEPEEPEARRTRRT